MPEGSECPVACHNPPPAECMEGETVCDMGMSEEGCWWGDYCMPEGEECPPAARSLGRSEDCPEPAVAECIDTDIT